MKIKKIKKSNKVINLFNIPEEQYSFKVNVVSISDVYENKTQIIHIANIKVCINDIWLRIKHSREMCICIQASESECLNLRRGDIVGFNAKLVDEQHEFSGIQQKNGYARRIPFCIAPFYLPLDYNGDITVRIGETIHIWQTNETKYRYYLVKLDRKSFDKEEHNLLTPAFSKSSETKDGYFRHVESISFTDKRFDILGDFKKLSK